MKNLKNIVVKIGNQSEKIAALHFLSHITGKSISPMVLANTLEGNSITDFPYIYAEGDKIGATSNSRSKEVVPFNKIACLLTENKVEVKLNDSYTAVVSPTEITVGCQTFPIGIVAALNEALAKVKENN